MDAGPLADKPTVSVIIPTLDRCRPLQGLLDALRWQTLSAFEVVLVVGPCSDDTISALDQFADFTRVVHNPERNVSMSRNIGATAAMGDILAFIDDDEIPEPTWLEDLVAGFDDAAVGAVGGAVFGVNGRDLDWLYCSADMYGAAYLSVDEPTHLQEVDARDPARKRLQYFPGGNCAVRRAALNSIDGFDETIVYYLDETDMFFRLQRAGWTMRQLQRARIHHLQLAGIVRAADDQRTTNWLTILQSRVTFAGKYAVELVGSQRVIDELSEWAAHVQATFSDREALEDFNRELELCKSRLRELDPSRAGMRHSAPHFVKHDAIRSNIVPFPTIPASARSHVVVVCHQHVTRDDMAEVLLLARSHALRGQVVGLIVTSDRSVTRWDDGVWRHEIGLGLGDHDWNAAVVDELVRVDALSRIDFVIADGLPSADHGWTTVRPPTIVGEIQDELQPAAGTAPVGARLASHVLRKIRPAVRSGRAVVEPPVFVRLIGGAGNELFQYAAALTIGGEKRARAIARGGNSQLRADALVPGFIRYAGRPARRVLEFFTAPSQVHKSSWRDLFFQPLREALAHRTVDQHGELQKAVSPPDGGSPRPVLLDGYFQHPGWYEPGDAIIIRALLANAPPGWAELASSRYAVVNFRRQDFETLGWTVPDDYYDAALSLVGTSLPLAVVGDDPAYVARKAREYRERGFEILVPKPLTTNEAVNDFWTVAGAQLVVMSNSTFCWWATRVGDAASPTAPPDRIVLCPRTWIPALENYLVQPTWTAVDPPPRAADVEA